MGMLGIYVQVPFCQTKCTYCNFHTGVVAGARFAPYVEAVCKEIREHERFLAAAGVGWPGRLGRSSAAPLQSEMGVGKATNEVRRKEPGAKPRAKQIDEDSQEWLCHRHIVDTVYIGGGTPSLLHAGHLRRLLETIRSTFVPNGRPEQAIPQGLKPSESRALLSERKLRPLGGSIVGPYMEFEEVTLEADPETIEAEKAEAWVAAGINRVSFGVQSFSDKELAAAGRMHRRADIYRAVPILRDAGIRNISFDLIAGLPHQTRESWEKSLEELATLGPEHVSVYLLEVDEGSRLGKELLSGGTRYSVRAVPSEDEMAEFYELAQEKLGAAGYEQYEISNWAKPGFASKHNLKYWRRGPYLGFGAGAHSFSGTERWANAHDAATYVSAVESGRLPVEQHEKVSAEQALEEELFLGLRQLEGIDVGRIEREYGVELEQRMMALAEAGLIEREGDVARLARKRLGVSNEVFVELLK